MERKKDIKEGKLLPKKTIRYNLYKIIIKSK